MDWSKQKRSSVSAGSFQPQQFHNQQYYQYVNSSQHAQLAQPRNATLPVRSGYYESHAPLFCSDWSPRELQPGFHTIGLSSYKEHSINKIEIVETTPELVEHADGSKSDGISLRKLTDASVDLPITKLRWDPAGTSKLCTTTNVLNLWELQHDDQLVQQATLANKPDDTSKISHPPLTSFDWNKLNTNLVITSSIDTTCTVWDLNRPVFPKTQLIAHDSEVFDVSFIKGQKDIFASVGCDGSVRVFDLRCLEHSTIVYEPRLTSDASSKLSKSGSETQGAPLLRLATSNTDSNIMATFVAKSNSIAIIDMRYPGYAISTLKAHSSSVNTIKWHPNKSKLLSGGDDCQALLWDLKGAHLRNSNGLPESVYGDVMEVNDVSWSSQGDWFGVVSGKGFQAVKV